MNCIKFIDLIPYYLDNDIDLNTKKEMNEHIKNCKNCEEQLNIRKELIDSFKYVLEDEDLKFKSRKEEIMKTINKSKYYPNLTKKMFYHLNKHKIIYSGTLVASFLVVMVLNLGGNSLNTSKWDKGLNMLTNDEASTAQVNSDKTADVLQKQSVIVEQPNQEIGTEPIKPQFDSTVTVSFDALTKDQLNPTGTGISSIVNSEYSKKLAIALEKMRKVPPGVALWDSIYCNNGKLIFYDYRHLVAYNYSEKEKGIYSILDFSNLKVGSYQGDEVIEFSFSPDGNYCLIGTLIAVNNQKSDKSLYLYNINNGDIKEIATNFSMTNNITWYNSFNSSNKWIVSATSKDDTKTILWDVDKSKALVALPTGIKIVKDNAGKSLDSFNLIIKDSAGSLIKLDSERSVSCWKVKDTNTLIGVSYRENLPDIETFSVADFEILEMNINDKTGKIVFRP